MQIEKYDIVNNKNPRVQTCFYVLEVPRETDNTIALNALLLEEDQYMYVNTLTWSRLLFEDCEIIHNDSFKEMLSHLDQSLEEFEIDPLICTLYDENNGRSVICLLSGVISNIIVDTTVADIYMLKNQNDIDSIWAGKNTENFRIIEYYDTISDALKAPEMFTYQDVLDEI